MRRLSIPRWLVLAVLLLCLPFLTGCAATCSSIDVGEGLADTGEAIVDFVEFVGLVALTYYIIEATAHGCHAIGHWVVHLH